MTKKPSSTRRFLTYLLGGAVTGMLLGFITGYYGLELKPMTLDIAVLADYLAFPVLLLAMLGLMISIYHYVKIGRLYKTYLETEGDEESELAYAKLAKTQAYATIFIGLTTAVSLFQMMVVLRLNRIQDGLVLTFPLLALIVLFVALILQMRLLAWHNKIRGSKTPLLPSLKELRNNAMELDEAELEANYKMAFETLMTLTGVIIPIIYMLLFVLAIVFGRVELVAGLVALCIHVYIISMQFKMVHHFYK